MDNISDSAWNRLPRAVRHHIEKMEADLRDVNNSMAEVLGSPGKSNVVLPYYLADMTDQYLPNNCRVQFALPYPRRKGDIGYIEVRHDGEGGLEIHGSHPISIEPGASNAATLKLRDV